MSVTSLRPILRHNARPVWGDLALCGDVPDGIGSATSAEFGLYLLREGRLSSDAFLAALTQSQRQDIPFEQALLDQNALPSDVLYAALSTYSGLGLASLVSSEKADPALLSLVDPATCLHAGWVPWRRFGQSTIILCAYPHAAASLRATLPPIFGPIIFALAPRAGITAALLAAAGAHLAQRAETRAPAGESCRSFDARPLYWPLGGAVLGLGLMIALAPKAAFLAAIALALVISYALTALKLAAILAPAARENISAAAQGRLMVVTGDKELPRISIMVALYHESRIVARLIRRLQALDYPRDKLEVIFVTEDNDIATATALSGLDLPPWLRVLPVPAGKLRTKPRALNYGLDHCTGDIVGVYDAEDAPDADQLRRVAALFAAASPRLACLQGRLDYYNPHKNWMSRAFTIEYAAWWRIVLPGIERLGLALPLGGTTLFFPRKILVEVGAWDAHNVTEDADLGIRLARRGYQTHLFDSTTLEEANCHIRPWVKQRSRWIKGYMITYATHMRAPMALLRELGPRRFWGFQVMFLGSILQTLVAPLLWMLWLVPFGAFDAALAGVPAPLLALLAATGVLTEAFMMGVNYRGTLLAGHKISPLWLPSMIGYNMLATAAAYKALWEVLVKPFYWDKTSHGQFGG